MKSKCHPRSARGARGDWARTKANGIRREAAGGEGSAQPLLAAAAAPAPPPDAPPCPEAATARPPARPWRLRSPIRQRAGPGRRHKGSGSAERGGSGGGRMARAAPLLPQNRPRPAAPPPAPPPRAAGNKSRPRPRGGSGPGRAPPGYRAPDSLWLRCAPPRGRNDSAAGGGAGAAGQLCPDGAGALRTAGSPAASSGPPGHVEPAAEGRQRARPGPAARGTRAQGGGIRSCPNPGIRSCPAPGFRAPGAPGIRLWGAPGIDPYRSRNPNTVLLGSIRAALRVRARGHPGIHPCPVPGIHPRPVPCSIPLPSSIPAPFPVPSLPRSQIHPRCSRFHLCPTR